MGLARGPLSWQERPFSYRGRAVTKKEKGCGERMKEKERERRAPLSWLSWPVSFERFDVRHGVFVEGGFSFLCATVRECSMRWFDSLHA